MLGDRIEQALAKVGVTPALVERLLGKPCGGCGERKRKLNALDAWARRVLAGATDKATEYLGRILGG